MNRSEIIEPHFAALLTPTKSRVTIIFSAIVGYDFIFATTFFGLHPVHTFGLN